MFNSKTTNPPQASVVHPPEAEKCPSPDLEIPSKKICHKEDDLGEVRCDLPSSSEVIKIQNTGEAESEPTSTAIKDVNPVRLSEDATVRLTSFIKDFQKKYFGSKSLMTFGSQNQLEHICFQTSSMSSWFLKYPERLLLHRDSSRHDYILYTFLVETKGRKGKIVHFSFVTEDNANNISKMLEMFKHFNSEWTKVKVMYTDIAFGHTDILKKTFPSAMVLLSVYHTTHFIERDVKFQPSMKYLIDDLVYGTSSEKTKLAKKLEFFMDKDLYAKLCKDWFSNEFLWNMHVKKGTYSIKNYMSSLSLIDERISSCLARQSSMENAVEEFFRSADSFNKLLQKGRHSSFSTNTFKVPPKSNSKRLSALEAPPSSSKVSLEPMVMAVKAVDPDPKIATWNPVNLVNKILLSLKEYCNDVCFQLCSKEFDVVQSSCHLIGEQLNFTTVQLLEDTYTVSSGGHSCTCYFNKDYNLPCRHVLSILHACKRPVEENMVSSRWRKNYVKPISDSQVYCKVMCHTKSKAETEARVGMIKSLAKEFYYLLMSCDGQEMQVRLSKLQMMIDMWQNASSEQTPCLGTK